MQGQPAARLEVRSASGNLLFTVTVSEVEHTPTVQSGEVKPVGNNGQTKLLNGPNILTNKMNGQSHVGVKSNPKNEEPLMSDAQKRLLFRLLADKGIEGDKAHEHLKKQFQVNTLKEVTRLEASREIDKLLEDTKGGRSFHAAA